MPSDSFVVRHMAMHVRVFTQCLAWYGVVQTVIHPVKWEKYGDAFEHFCTILSSHPLFKLNLKQCSESTRLDHGNLCEV